MHIMNDNTLTVFVDILGYQEDGEWVALALDMDLRGFGGTFEEAMEDLKDHINMQVSFALQKNNLDMVYRPADRQFYNMYEQAKRASLARLLNLAGDSNLLATGFPISRSDIGNQDYALAYN